MTRPASLTKNHKSNAGKMQDASSLNRTYQQALMDIIRTIKNPTPETLVAIQRAEDIAFRVETLIGKEFRRSS